MQSTKKGGFISPVDRTDDGAVNIKIHNTNSENLTYSLFTETRSGGRLASFASQSVEVPAGGVTEINLASVSGSANSEIRCYLLEPTRLRPFCEMVAR